MLVMWLQEEGYLMLESVGVRGRGIELCEWAWLKVRIEMEEAEVENRAEGICNVL